MPDQPNRADQHSPALPPLADHLRGHRGLVSVYVAPEDAPARPYVNTRPRAQHYAASTMKVAILLAAHRAFDAGTWAPDTTLAVHADFASQAGGRFDATRDYDSDGRVWDRLGEDVPVGWLLQRMIVRSSNLATNLALEHLGFDAVNQMWELAGSPGCAVQRMIQDSRADWLTNQVTAPGLSLLMHTVVSGAGASASATEAMTATLLANELTADVAAGLPPTTWVAHKNGWIDGVQHTTAVIRPGDAPGYLLTVCSSTGLGQEDGQRLVADIARASWHDRHLIAAGSRP